ncbi:MAG TPA: cobalamin biosynthesis protein [Candidatus Competibacteraceae bacterium]|nr:cobalamin biosynthesis protein [Candidatus Competibacteraceae bacterium]
MMQRPVTIVSLTAPGAALAERLLVLMPDAEHLHRPQPFQETVQTRFQAGHALVLIMACGIAVRTLASVLQDKYRDPPVLVLDEHGHHVIPLLAGHEGGANAWGERLARDLGGQCVITGARRYTDPVLVAGMGCERGCPEAVLRELLEHSLGEHGLYPGQLAALASIEIKRDEAGLLALAQRLGVPAVFYPAGQLDAYAARLTQRSEIVRRETGCYGVAEAAALAHAEALTGTAAELLIPKRKNARATFALARGYRDTLGR